MDPRIFFDGLFFFFRKLFPSSIVHGTRLEAGLALAPWRNCMVHYGSADHGIMDSTRTRHVMHPEEVQNCIVISHTLGSQCSVQRVVVMGHVVCSAPFEARVRCCAQMLQSHTKSKQAKQHNSSTAMPQMLGRCVRANMHVEDPDLATLEKMPSATLPSHTEQPFPRLPRVGSRTPTRGGVNRRFKN